MYNLLFVFLGGGIGAGLRFLFSMFAYRRFKLTYWATFLINIVGCVFLGVIAAFASKNSAFLDSRLYLFLTTGIAGGFTTFSTFSYENFELLRQGKILKSIIYVLSSLIFGLFAVYLGFRLL